MASQPRQSKDDPPDHLGAILLLCHLVDHPSNIFTLVLARTSGLGHGGELAAFSSDGVPAKRPASIGFVEIVLFNRIHKTYEFLANSKQF
jgi:hypothetical protein